MGNRSSVPVHIQANQDYTYRLQKTALLFLQRPASVIQISNFGSVMLTRKQIQKITNLPISDSIDSTEATLMEWTIILHLNQHAIHLIYAQVTNYTPQQRSRYLELCCRVNNWLVIMTLSQYLLHNGHADFHFAAIIHAPDYKTTQDLKDMFWDPTYTFAPHNEYFYIPSQSSLTIPDILVRLRSQALTHRQRVNYTEKIGKLVAWDARTTKQKDNH